MSHFYPYRYKGHPGGRSSWIYPMPSEKERDRRWQAIRTAMKKQGFDCLIAGGASLFTFGRTHVYYMTNYLPFAGRGTYVVFPLDDEGQLGVEYSLGPQFLHLATETSWIKNIVGSFDPAQDIIHKIKQLKLENGKIGIIGYGAGILPGPVYEALRKNLPGAAFEEATVMLNEVMNEVSRSSQEEHELLEMSCEIIDLSFNAVAEALKPGVKECELCAAAEHAILKHGGWFPHFMLVTSGPRPSFLRLPPSQNTLNRGDIVIFEINVTVGGVSPQVCYALSLGRPQKDIEDMYKFRRELYGYALAEIEGMRIFIDIEKDITRRIQDAGFDPMTPQIHCYNMSSVMPMNSPARPGDYFTVHPNCITLDYAGAAKFGDAVRITKEGKVQRLQKTPAQLNIV